MVTTLARVVRAREALDDGDLYLAATILADLEEDLAGGELVELPPRRLTCPDCHATFRWPGELDHHQRFVHWQAAA